MKLRNYRWLVVLLLFFATTINYLDRQIIGLLKPTLEKEFSWTETDFAHIVMAFTAAYALGLVAFGRLIDVVGTKWGYAISVTIWSIAGILHAAAKGVGGFVAVRIGLGIGEAGNFPAAVKAVSEWFPKKERALATGLFNAGTSIGVVIALLVTPWLLSSYGWRGVFLATGAVGFVWLIFWWWLYDIPSRQKKMTAEELGYISDGRVIGLQTNDKPISWRSLFRFPQTWAVIIGKLFIDPIYWFFLFWLPSYFSSVFKLDLTKPSPELMIIYAATTVGSIGGGYLSSLLIKRGWKVLRARMAVLLLFAFFEVSIILAQFASDVWMAVGLISLAVAAHQAWATNIFTLASDLFPKNTVSSVVGVSGMAGAIGGILFPIFVGSLLDAYKLQDKLTDGYNFLFTVCGVTYLLVWTVICGLLYKSRRNSLTNQ